MRPHQHHLDWLSVNEEGRIVRNGRVVCHPDNSHGYRKIRLGDHFYMAHRVVFALVHGRWPEGVIDHINGVKDDNKPTNLRECSHAQNVLNRRPRARSCGTPAGVFQVGNGFKCKTSRRGERFYAGPFATAEEAHQAYRKMCNVLRGEFSPYWNE